MGHLKTMALTFGPASMGRASELDAKGPLLLHTGIPSLAGPRMP